MKKIIFVGILCLTSCAEDDRVRCNDLDGGTVDGGCVDEQIIAFPDQLNGQEKEECYQTHMTQIPRTRVFGS